MKRFKDTGKSKRKAPTLEKQEADGSLSQSTSCVACLVCHRPCKMTSNSLIPSLPFCKGCKSTYFSLMANHSKSDDFPSSRQPQCPKGGQCIIDYRKSSFKEWCSSCHVRKFQAILRRFDTLLVNTDCDQPVNEPHPDLSLLGNPDLNPIVLVEKLTSQDLASLGIETPETLRSDKSAIGERENHTLPSKSSSGMFQRQRSFPLAKQLKRRKKWASWRKKSRATNPFMKSIEIYVFDCGHACKVCNSAQSKKWLKDCGFHTAPPSAAEAIHPTVNHCTNSLPLSPGHGQWSSSFNGSTCTLSAHQPGTTKPENPRESHSQTQPNMLLSLHDGAAISQSSQSQAGGSPSQILFPVVLPVSVAPQRTNGLLLYGTVPIPVESLNIKLPPLHSNGNQNCNFPL